MTVTVSRTFGNYAWKGSFLVPALAVAALVEAGIVRTVQSKPSSEVEKTLAAYGKKRPEGFKRTDIPFSEAGVAEIKKVFGSIELTFTEVGADGKETEQTVTLSSPDLAVTEYVPTASGEPKYALAKKTINDYLAAAPDRRTVEMFATNREITPAPTKPWDEDTEFLAAVQDWIVRSTSSKD